MLLLLSGVVYVFLRSADLLRCFLPAHSKESEITNSSLKSSTRGLKIPQGEKMNYEMYHHSPYK
jgi:hypothetical protein